MTESLERTAIVCRGQLFKLLIFDLLFEKIRGCGRVVTAIWQ